MPHLTPGHAAGNAMPEGIPVHVHRSCRRPCDAQPAPPPPPSSSMSCSRLAPTVPNRSILSDRMTPVTQAIRSLLIIVQTSTECCLDFAHMGYRMFHGLVWVKAQGHHIPVSSSPSHRSRFHLVFRKTHPYIGHFGMEHLRR